MSMHVLNIQITYNDRHGTAQSMHDGNTTMRIRTYYISFTSDSRTNFKLIFFLLLITIRYDLLININEIKAKEIQCLG